MSSAPLPLPRDDSLGELAERFAPARVLAAARERLTRVDAGRRSAWSTTEVVEVLYHPRRYLRAAYAFLSDPAPPPERRWPQGDLVYLFWPPRETLSRRGERLRLGGSDVEAYLFPNDRRLRGLRRFTSTAAAVATWQRWLDARGASAKLRRETLQRTLVRYVPEQKWVARLRAEVRPGDGGEPALRRIAIRASTAARCAALQSRHEQMAAALRRLGSGYHVPAVEGALPEQGILAVEWIRGQTLVEALREASPGEVLTRVAELLRAVHATRVSGLAPLRPAQLAHAVRDACEDLCCGLPESCGELHDLSDWLEEELGRIEPAPAATLHNDFHFNQFRIKRDRLALFDLECMCLGDPLIDVANLAAQLALLGERPETGVSPGEAAHWSRLFLDEWQRQTGRASDPAALRVYSAAALLRLARGMLRHARPGWRELAHVCIRRISGQMSAAPAEGAA